MQYPLHRIKVAPIGRDSWLVDIFVCVGEDELVGSFILDADWHLVFTQIGVTVARIPHP